MCFLLSKIVVDLTLGSFGKSVFFLIWSTFRPWWLSLLLVIFTIDVDVSFEKKNDVNLESLITVVRFLLYYFYLTIQILYIFSFYILLLSWLKLMDLYFYLTKIMKYTSPYYNLLPSYIFNSSIWSLRCRLWFYCCSFNMNSIVSSFHYF